MFAEGISVLTFGSTHTLKILAGHSLQNGDLAVIMCHMLSLKMIYCQVSSRKCWASLNNNKKKKKKKKKIYNVHIH